MELPGPDPACMIMKAQEMRSELLEVLDELGRAHPEWRLGQTLSNLAMAAGRPDAGGVWGLEDEEGLAAARLLLSQREAVLASSDRSPSTVRRGFDHEV